MMISKGDWAAVDRDWGDLLPFLMDRFKGDFEIIGDVIVPAGRPAIEAIVDARRFKKPEFWEYLRRADLLGREVSASGHTKLRFSQGGGSGR